MEDLSPPQVTQMLRAWAGGDRAALDALVPQVYRELKRIAAGYLKHERQGHTLQVSALVNEAYMRLADVHQMEWKDRAHFFAMSSQLMRRVLVDHARGKAYQKRGAGAFHTQLDEGLMAVDKASELVDLDDALNELEKVDARKARVVELRFFAGLTVEDAAEVLGVSEETVHRDWRLAKAWLARELAR